MKDIKGVIGLLCLIVVFGRIAGAWGEWVMFHPHAADTSYAIKTTASGYFVAELPPGKCDVNMYSGFHAVIDVPGSGILFWEISTPVNPIESAVKSLQTAVGLR